MMQVLIVGAGPAGLGAAAVLAQAGARVTVVERQGVAGGVPRLCGHSPFGIREFRRVLGGRAYADRLVKAAAGAEVLLHHAVTAIEGGTVHIATPQGPLTLTPDRILLATGAREASRAERFLPGERPLGVVTTGALQDLWFARGALPFRRPVILGSELVAMSAILTCRQAGAAPVAVIEAQPRMIAAAPFRWLPTVLGVPVLTCMGIADIVAKDGRVCAVVTTDGRQIDCDGVVLTGAFRPESGLARMCGLAMDAATGGPVVDQSGRTSRPEIYAAGNLLRGIETAGACWAEGRAIARAMLADLGGVGAVEVRCGPGVRYVMPQRVTPGAGGALPALQVRIDHFARGTVTVTDGLGRRIGSLQVDTGPERRVQIDLDALPVAVGPWTVAMEDA